MNLKNENGILIPEIKDGNDLGNSVDGVYVKFNTVNHLVEKNKLNKIDFLSIDVEGAEIMVLEGIDFNKYNPFIICIEYNQQIMRERIINYLKTIIMFYLSIINKIFFL